MLSLGLTRLPVLQRSPMGREGEKLRTEREALLKAREEDPEKRSLMARVRDLEGTIKGLRTSEDILSTRAEWMGELIKGCPQCSKRFAYLCLNDEEFASKYSKDPMVKLLASLKSRMQ